ncbi:MAG: glycosyltransferase family 2 protein [Solirubrobacteraceae bacterium]
MAASIDVVVPAYNRYELTHDCLAHLARQTAAHRTIVVDDGSSDDTPARVRRDWPHVTIVELGANRGYTRAVNRGVSAGEGEYVVLLNNDVQLRPDCLERLVVPLSDDPTVGSVAATMLARDERTIDSVGVTADATLAGFARLQGRPIAEATLSTPVLTGPEGAAGAYRRVAWEQAGGLDETIVAYMEILDLALRLRTVGWTTASAPDACGVHLGSITYGKRSAGQRRLAGFSRGYLLRRYGVLRSRKSARTLLTETAVVAGDIAICHDIQALRGRVQGWHAAAGMSRHPRPPDSAIAESISLWESLRLRRAALRAM